MKKKNNNKLNRELTHDVHWDKSASVINLIKDKGPVTRHLQIILLRFLEAISFKSVYEVGCGQGVRLGFLHKKFPQAKYAGGDISDVAITLAKKNYSKVSFDKLDIEKSYIKKKYDLILCLDVLEHIVKDVNAIRNMRKMTNKYLIVSSMQGKMRKTEGPEGHVRNYAYGELSQKLEKGGFRVLKVIQWGFPFHSPFYRDLLDTVNRVHKKVSKGTYLQQNNPVDASMPFLVSLVGEPLYQLMRLNSSKKGDYIFVLAEAK